MKIIKTKFKDFVIIKSKNFYDNRGFFREILIEKIIKKKFKFNVVSNSKKNVLRGLHMQKNFPQGKYVSVLKGSILDVVVDCRKNSKTFGKHFKIIISEKNAKSIYVPPGFIHGFLGLKKKI
jgi:dTDP-4-dehydrorhamnose 3,5-epimerase